MATTLNVYSCTSHHAMLGVVTGGGAGSAVAINKTTLAACAFGTPWGATLTKLQASQLFKLLSRSYASATDAMAAGYTNFSYSITPGNDPTQAFVAQWSNLTTDGIHYYPQLDITPNNVNGAYYVNLSCPNSITR